MNTDTKLNKSMLSLVEQYASCDARSKEINDERATIRENAEKLGIPSAAFQAWVSMHKKMSPGELRDHLAGIRRLDEAAEAEGVDIQGDFFPDAKKAAERREKRRADALAEKNKGKAGAPDPDTNPRSDPKRGGAGKKKGERPTEEQLTAAASEAEQQAGEDALKGLAPETAAAQTEAKTPKSQSQIAAEKMEAAKLN